MLNKAQLRKKYFTKRKKKYFEISANFFNPFLKYIKLNFKKKKINLAIYYPSNYEVNVIHFFSSELSKKFNISLPIIKNKNKMHFSPWKNHNVLKINRYGMLEPEKLSDQIKPNIILVPMLAYDKYKNRLGYGGGFYDRFLKQYLNSHNDILTVGIAFSFQKHHKLPITDKDVKMNLILTEKGLTK